VEAIWVDADDPRVAIAVLGARSSVAAGFSQAGIRSAHDERRQLLG